MNSPEITKHVALTGEERFCPYCETDWQGAPIPKHIRKHYGKSTHWHKLIGVEIRGRYDGVAFWKCPSCSTEFVRRGFEQLYADRHEPVHF